MKNLIGSMIIAFSMYSKIPMLNTEWKEENMRYTFVFFPLVGLVIGAIIYSAYWLFMQYEFQGVFFGATAVLLNVLLTGGIHMDGFCDVMDAQSSHKGREEKLSIMKDPHVGAFAVICTAVLLIVQFGAYTQLFYTNRYLVAALLTFCISRIASGLACICFPCAKESGLALIFAKGASKKPVVFFLIVWAVFAYTALQWLYGWFGIVYMAVSLLLFFWFYRFCKQQFGGITGDLAGFFLNVFETVMLILAVLLGGIR